jgi:predicted cupin superfamily sugar epimerase
MQNAEYWVQHLDLLPHPEGGFYKEMYRSNLSIDQQMLPYGFKGSRRICTSIYYLLRTKDISKLHRLKSDEIWYYHYGGSLKIVMIDQEGKKFTKMLGPNAEKSDLLQVEIPAGTIFGAMVSEENSYCLVGCVVTPGFEFSDFELFDREDLIQAYPKHADLINKFT